MRIASFGPYKSLICFVLCCFAELVILENYANMERAERREKLKSMTVRDSMTLKYHCMLCNKPFKRADHVYTHLEIVHIQVPAYKCDFCDRSFCTKVYLITHIKRKHAVQKQEQIMFDCLQ